MLAFTVLALVAVTRIASADERRPLPDYDGRGNQDADAASWALWIPRVLLWPVAVVHEYVIRRPLGALITTAERHRWASRIHDFFTFGPGQRDYLIPAAEYEFGMEPSVGAYLSLVDVLAAGNEVRVHGATWGPSWLSATVVDRQSWDARRTSLAVQASFLRRPDYLFLGIGPDVTDETRSRYGRQRFDVRTVLAHKLRGESSFSLAAGAQQTSFRPGECCVDPTLDQRIADGTLAMPPGYGAAYATLFQRAELVLDSRAPRPAPGSGGYLRLHGQTNINLTDDSSWIAYGGVIGGALDLDGRQRTLKLEVGVDFVDPVSGFVPFDELASLGSDMMPGFVPGWMNGRSTVVAQAAYTWPVWLWLDGELRFSAGNAFGEHLEGLEPAKLRLSGEVGLLSSGARDRGFEIVFGLGTETLEQGGKIDSIRFAFRSRWGL